jgi:para-nitrobenzyl esterase
MLRRTFVSLLFVLTVGVGFSMFDTAPVMNAANGTIKIEGGMISGALADGVRSFKGVPFAAPPVGDLRWRPPQPVAAWQGVRECNEYGPDCPQAPYPSLSLFYSPPRKQSEDCLYLNVWTAANDGEKRPVMVWIYGGGLTRGSGAVPTYDGTALAKKGVVLITINYRIGPFGYLAHPELTAESSHRASGNYGVLDQIAALQWVRKNIAAFGGDPNRVTIFGESAGSWSVNVLAATPLAKDLFHRAIGESGGQFGPMATLGEAEKNGAAFAKAAGAQDLKAFRDVPAEKIVALFNHDPEGKKFKTQPVVDRWVLPDEIRNIFAQGKQNKTPVIVGSNANEMTSLTGPGSLPKTMEEYRKRVDAQYGAMSKDYDAAYPVKNEAEIPAAYLGAMRDSVFTLAMRTWARMATDGRSKAYHYYFSHAPPNRNSQYLGAYHAGEIAYVFNNLNRQNPLMQEADYKLADLMSSYWVNFAATGDPNGKGLPSWKPYTRETEPYLDFGDPVQLRNHLLKEQLDFIERFQSRR